MDHVDNKQIRFVRWAFILYGLHFLVGYFFVYFTQHTWKGNSIYFPVLAILVAIQLIYELIAWLKYRNRSLWFTTLISLAFVLLETYTVVENSGVFKSPYMVALLSIVFVSGAMGVYLPMGITFVLIIRYLLTFSGAFTNNGGGAKLGLLVVTIGVVDSLASITYWRKQYTYRENPKLNQLSRMLKSKEQQSEIIFQSIADGVVIFDTGGKISYINSAATKLAGWQEKDALGIDVRLVLKLAQENGAELKTDPLAEALHGKQVSQTVSLKGREKGQTIISIAVSPVIIQTDNLVGGVAVMRDVTEERRAEHQRADFISTASHEMRTPVAAIEGYLALALNDKVCSIDTKARGFLEKAHESTEHLGKLFQDLLTSAKAEDGRLSNHPAVVEMGEFLEQLTNDLRFAAKKKNLDVEFLLGSGHNIIDASHPSAEGATKVIKPLYYVYADPDRLREVITNLFDNGVKYSEQGKISIAITGNNDVVQFYIKDTGYGIPADDIPHLFQKFYRVDNSETRTIGGTGLGLFICRKIVELYGGRIWVESKLGTGSTFFINLPRLTTQKAEQLQKEPADIVEPTPSATPAS